jgi:hypothetical protein
MGSPYIGILFMYGKQNTIFPIDLFDIAKNSYKRIKERKIKPDYIVILIDGTFNFLSIDEFEDLCGFIETNTTFDCNDQSD